MKIMSRFAVAVATLLLCTTLLIVATPKRTEGVVATAVQVVNSSLAVDTENSTVRTPFEANIYAMSGTFQVPDNQRLVLEYVSSTCEALVPTSGPGPATTFTVTTRVNGNYVNHYFATVPSGGEFFGSTFFNVAQTTHLYADAGSIISTYASGANFQSCAVGLSGYLVNH